MLINLKLVFTITILVALTSCASMGFLPEQYQISDFQMQSLRNNEIPLAIYNYETSTPNSANGVDARIRFQNISDQTIKYVIFTVTPFNRVGDVVFSQIGRRSTTTLRNTGPISPGERVTNSYFRNVWYNPSIVRLEVDLIEVIFMDDTSVKIEKEQISQMMVR